jgi:hypothetical protein
MHEESQGGKPADVSFDWSQLGIFKYCSDNDQVIEGIFEKHEIRFTQPAALNDPLEFQPTIRFKERASRYTNFVFDGVVFPSEELWLRVQLVERQLNAFGVLSLTRIPDSFDMWSRYANGHKGFLLELKADFNQQACMRGTDGRIYEVREVDYVDQYGVNIDDLVDEHGDIPFDSYNKQVFFTKTSRWRHEKEYRMVRPLRDHPTWKPKCDRTHRDRKSCYRFEFPLGCIQSVTFGACMAVENKRRIVEVCKGAGIDFLQAIIVKDQEDRQGLLTCVKLVPATSFPNLLDMSDADLITDSENLPGRSAAPVEVARLSALPYYHRNEQWVAEYYRKRKARRSS